MNNPKEILKQYFGYDSFRGGQEDIINSILQKKDTLVLMPTGGGKSLCYQIPALCFNGVTLVISPLLSLMKDQVDALRANSIPAAYLNSTLTSKQIQEIEHQLLEGSIKLLYIAPERLASKSFRELLEKLIISLVAIDEAHCISEWGHDFRPDYKRLKYVKGLCKGAPIIALTATATKQVKKDILKQLNLKEPAIFQSSFNRENLLIEIREKKNSLAQILALLEKNKEESTIIYSHSRDEAKSLCDELNHYGFKSLLYHAGLSDSKREKNQELFLEDKAKIIVATIAFGMGIDKSNVRLVIHNTFSKSLENYYQEIGRAGRDGIKSKCILFFSERDIKRHEYFIGKGTTPTTRKEQKSKLSEMVKFCTSTTCRKKTLLNYFNEAPSFNFCKSCDNCLNTNKTNNDSLPLKLNSFDQELFKELKNLREEFARETQSIPTHLFSDVTLQEIAQKLPNNEKELLKIQGITQSKIQEFGDELLMIIQEYRMAHEVSKNIVKIKPSILEAQYEYKNEVSNKDGQFQKKPRVFKKKKKYKKSYKKKF